MKLLTNPILLRMALVFIAAGFAFVMGVVLMRQLRRGMVQEVSFAPDPSASESFPLQTYHAVIQQLKQQKHELLSEQQAERRRAKASENISAAVLSNLSSGVMFFTPNGLVRRANAAAKQILGFASPLGMSTADVFRKAELVSPGTAMNLAETIQACLREKTASGRIEAQYTTPGGEVRALEVRVTPVPAPNGEVLGAACLINDCSEISQIRRQHELHGEISAEMALELRTSLITISGYAKQLAASHDAEATWQLAADIAVEAAHLDKTIGGFLVGARAANAGSEA